MRPSQYRPGPRGPSFSDFLALPEDVNPGAVIGRKARNARWISTASGGARLTVEEERVLIQGRSAQVVETAKRLLRDQFEAAERLRSPEYQRPLRVDYVLLREAYGAAPRLAFVPSYGEAATSQGRAETAFVASPVGASGSGAPSAADSLAGMMAGSSLRGPAPASRSNEPQEAFWHSSGRVSGVAAALSASVHAAASQQRAFDNLKIRANLGKQLFYRLPAVLASGEPHSLQELQAHPRLESVYSNTVPRDALRALTRYATQRLGLSLVDTRRSATLHVLDERLNVKYVIALDLGGEGAAERVTLRKVKTAQARCHFVALVGGPQQVDVRAKLLGQTRDLRDPTAQSVARQLVQAAQQQGYARALGQQQGQELLPGMLLDVARCKAKQVYEGTFLASSGSRVRIKLTTKTVQDERGEHSEVTCTLPDCDAQLKELLAGGGAGGGDGSAWLCDAAWAENLLRVLAELAEGLAAEMGGNEGRAQAAA